MSTCRSLQQSTIRKGEEEADICSPPQLPGGSGRTRRRRRRSQASDIGARRSCENIEEVGRSLARWRKLILNDFEMNGARMQRNAMRRASRVDFTTRTTVTRLNLGSGRLFGARASASRESGPATRHRISLQFPRRTNERRGEEGRGESELAKRRRGCVPSRRHAHHWTKVLDFLCDVIYCHLTGRHHYRLAH